MSESGDDADVPSEGDTTDEVDDCGGGGWSSRLATATAVGLAKWGRTSCWVGCVATVEEEWAKEGEE